jgi:hypothetical protein
MKKIWQAIAVLVAMGGVGAWPSWRLQGSEGVAAMVAGGIICFIAALASLAPMAIHRRCGVENLWQAYIMGIFIRLALTVVFGALYYIVMRPDLTFYALCVAIFYMIFLAWETYQAVGMVRTGQSRNSA